MCPKMSFWLMLHLAVLLAAVLVQYSEGATYQDFVRQHIDDPKTSAANNNAYCDLMMRRRGMTNRACKARNTFINYNARTIQNICRGGGRRVGRTNIYESRRSLPVVECRNRGRFPRCRYVGRRRTKKIRVGCVNRLPVHFQGPM